MQHPHSSRPAATAFGRRVKATTLVLGLAAAAIATPASAFAATAPPTASAAGTAATSSTADSSGAPSAATAVSPDLLAAVGKVGTGSDGDGLTRAIEVYFANTHWNWTAWNDSTPVAFGSAQPDYQCAEFVARAMAAAGLIPGLSPDAPQDDYFDYVAPNGKTYDLLLITPLPGYNTIYDYLMDSGLATDVGDDPAAAQPADMVVTYLGYDGEASHMGLVVTPQTATSEPTLDAHNNARIDYGYHYYEPAHLVKLVPYAFLEVWTWAVTQWAVHGIPPQEEQGTGGSTHAPLLQYADPSAPQV